MSWLPRWLIPGLILFLAVAAFLPALRNGFVNWDDDINLLQNPNYRGLGWAQLRWMFTDLSLGHYQPLSWATLGLDYLVWGMNPFGYHLTSLILHGVNGALFYFIALRLLSPAPQRGVGLRWAAAFAALFFSLHPLRVEAAAWATERRGVLAGLFFLLSLLCCLRAHEMSEGGRKRKWMIAAVVTYGMSLLSKASGIALPAVLLVLDVYPLGRLVGGVGEWFDAKNRRVWREKAPFVLLGLAAVALAFMAGEKAEAIKGRGEYGMVIAIAQPLFGLTFYLWKTLIPAGLSPLYAVVSDAVPAYWPFQPSQEAIIVLSIIVALGVTLALFLLRRRWPAGLAAWICYIALLAPVLGIVQIGGQIVADRYSYLPSLSWAMLAGGWLLHVWQSGGVGRIGKRGSSAIAITVLVTLAALTWRQTQVWHDPVRLWSHALAVIRESDVARNNLGVGLYEAGETEKAIEQFERVVDMDPGNTHYRDNLVKVLVGLGGERAGRGELDEAIRYLSRALEVDNSDAEAHESLGRALAQQGKKGEAAQHYQEALRLLRSGRAGAAPGK